MLVPIYQPTQRYTPEDRNLHTHLADYFKYTNHLVKNTFLCADKYQNSYNLNALLYPKRDILRLIQFLELTVVQEGNAACG